MKFGAVIVAAGLSSRMKAFKPMLELAGSTMIKTGIKTLQNAGVDPIVVITGHNHEALEKHLISAQVRTIYNEAYASTDMFYSALLGMNAIQDLCDAFFFLPADIPLFSSHTIHTLKEHIMLHPCDVLSPRYQDRGGHPLLIQTKCIPFFQTYTGDKGLKDALSQFSGSKYTLEVDDLGTTLDADHPEDFEKLQAYASHESRKRKLHCKVELTLSRETSFWPPELGALLILIDTNHSIRRSCKELGLSYSKAWQMLRIAEHQLGFTLITTSRGGSKGGSSILTPKGKRILFEYTQLEQELLNLCQTLFLERFQEFL